MAMKNGKSLPAITLLGQAGSGKTNLLTTFLNHNASWLDLEEGNDQVVNVSLKEKFDSGGEEERAFDYLRSHYVSMLSGREDLLEGTNAARRYGLSMSYSDAVKEEPPETGWLSRSRFKAKPTQRSYAHDFEIVDGRGADAAPSEMISSSDKDTIARRQAYRDGMDDSVGFVVFMPLMSDDEGSEAIISQRFLGELNNAFERKLANPKKHPKLLNVSLCFTKCERAFMRDGVYGLDEATSFESYERLLRGNAVLSTFRSLLSASLSEDSFEMRVFPVSTYGFIRNSGTANFYPWVDSPGLLTRSVDRFKQYDNPDIPDFKDHFPFELKDDQAKSMWRPFNIAPPLLYALTGRVTGPISFTAQEALDFVAD